MAEDVGQEDGDAHELEPVALDVNEDPTWVHACVVLDEAGKEEHVVHLSVQQYMGICDMREEHHKHITMLYTPEEALKLAGALMSASDSVAGVVLGSSEEPK